MCNELRAFGVQLALDDFGTGQSTLSRLRDLPVDEVKIDRSFIGNLDHDEARRRFVWGVVAFSERIGSTVVAEGVEREAELEALTQARLPPGAGLPVLPAACRPAAVDELVELPAQLARSGHRRHRAKPPRAACARPPGRRRVGTALLEAPPVVLAD